MKPRTAVILLVLVLLGILGMRYEHPVKPVAVSGTPAQIITDLDGVAQEMTTVSTDLVNAQQNGDLSLVASDCQVLGDAVTTLEADHVPNYVSASDQVNLTTGSEEIATGAQDCVQGAENNSPTLLDQAQGELTNGGAYLDGVTNDLTQG